MNYYNYLDPALFTNINSKKAGDKLIKEKYYGFITLLKNSITNKKTIPVNESSITFHMFFTNEYSKDDIFFNNLIVSEENKEKLKDKFYQSILECYLQYFIEVKSMFYKFFKNEIFGLDFIKQKEIALKYYKEIYNNINLKETEVLKNVSTVTEIKYDSALSKLEVVFKLNKIFKDNLIPTIQLILNLSDEKKFAQKFKPQFTVINKILNYEIWKQIMVEINKEFHFEEDLYSISAISDIATYEKYSHIFNSYDVYCFAKIKIDSFKTYPKAKSVALYQMLAANDLIKENHDNYKNYIEKEFGFSPSKIVKYEEKIRPSYDNRIKEYKKDWDNMVARKR